MTVCSVLNSVRTQCGAMLNKVAVTTFGKTVSAGYTNYLIPTVKKVAAFAIAKGTIASVGGLCTGVCMGASIGFASRAIYVYKNAEMVTVRHAMDQYDQAAVELTNKLTEAKKKQIKLDLATRVADLNLLKANAPNIDLYLSNTKEKFAAIKACIAATKADQAAIELSFKKMNQAYTEMKQKHDAYITQRLKLSMTEKIKVAAPDAVLSIAYAIGTVATGLFTLAKIRI